MLITDKSIVIYGFKHGSSAARNLARHLRDAHENVIETNTNEVLQHFKKNYEDNPVPIFINIRNPKQAIFSSYVQGIREISMSKGEKYYRDPFLKNFYDKAHKVIDKNPFAIFNGRLGIRDEIIVVRHFLENYIEDIYQYDEHIQGTLEYIQEPLRILRFIKNEKPEILENVFLVNLDNYETSNQSIGLLSMYNYMDQTLFQTEEFKVHSAKKYMGMMHEYQSNTRGPRGGMSLALSYYTAFYSIINSEFEQYEYTYKRLQRWTNKE